MAGVASVLSARQASVVTLNMSISAASHLVRRYLRWAIKPIKKTVATAAEITNAGLVNQGI